MLKFFLNSLFIIHNSKLSTQRGASTIYIVIIIIVIIFAVMFTGGPSSLLSGDLPSSVTNTPTPLEGSLPTTNPTQTQTSGWDITITLATNCQQGKYSYKEARVAITGQADGYITLEVNDNGYKQISTQKFTAPQGVYDPVILSNEFGFNINEWKIGLYSGGTFTNESWTGGTLQAEKSGSPTGCN